MTESVQRSQPKNAGRVPVLTSYDPRTGEVAGDYAVMGADDVTRAVLEARGTHGWWSGLGHDVRKRWLLDWKKSIVADVEKLADVVVRETGKPHDDAVLEIVLAVEHLDWAARHAGSVLGRQKVRSGKFGADQSASVGYESMGVVGVIGPWNYPVYTPMGSIAYAMAAGNAVVFKPSELTPGVGAWLAQSWHRLAPNHPVLQAVTGDGETGAALCRSRVDKIAFTGSPATARRVMGLCAETLTPLVVEGGGKDAMIVAVDADLDAAADAVVFGAMSNSGQTCAGVERVYVAESVYQPFLESVTAKAKRLHPGADRKAAYGPLTMPSQAAVVRRHIEDALANGGRAVVGGLDSIREPYVEPVVLTDVPETSAAVTEETFGPIVVINKVADLDDAVARANATAYGLGASIFTRDQKTAEQVADRLRAGVVTINSVLGFAAVAALPFGGVGDSGFGRIHGADGLREFSRAKAITVQRRRAPVKLLSMDRRARDVRIVKWLFKRAHG